MHKYVPVLTIKIFYRFFIKKQYIKDNKNKKSIYQ